MVSLGYLWLILTAGAPMPPATTALPSSDEMHCNILCDGTLDTLEKYGVTIYRTDEAGRVVTHSDGEHITVETE